jgi:hypothetical protein
LNRIYAPAVLFIISAAPLRWRSGEQQEASLPFLSDQRRYLMIDHVKELAREIAQATPAHKDIFTTLKVLPVELDKLNPEDFEPGARAEFVKVREKAKAIAAKDSIIWGQDKIPDFGHRVAKVLDSYQAAGSHKVKRSFTGIANPDLRAIVERDYLEFKAKLLPAAAWKSAVILAGSIIEAILYDRLTRDAASKSQAMACPAAPKNKQGQVFDIETEADNWKLFKIIDVVFALHILPKARENVFDHVLRDYRNFVHPRVEIKAKYSVDEGEARLSEGALEVVISELKL